MRDVWSRAAPAGPAPPLPCPEQSSCLRMPEETQPRSAVLPTKVGEVGARIGSDCYFKPLNFEVVGTLAIVTRR